MGKKATQELKRPNPVGAGFSLRDKASPLVKGGLRGIYV